jgi:predicted transposase/invertase (TIGR01784 family)
MRFTLRVNYMLRKLFGLEENKMLLKLFLNSFLLPNVQLKEVTLISRNDPNNEEEDRDTWSDRFSIPDIKAIDKKGRHCNIEIEVDAWVHYNKRMLYECTELYKNELKEGEDYSSTRKTISIHILTCDSFEKEKEYHNVFHVLIPTLDGYFEDFEFHFIELEKFNKSVHEPKNKLDKWIQFLVTANEYERHSLPKLFKNDLELRSTFEALEKLYFDAEEEEICEDQLMFMRDRYSFLAHARYEGWSPILIQQIRHKFGDIPTEFLSKMKILKEEEILALSERILESKTLEELFKERENDKI